MIQAGGHGNPNPNTSWLQSRGMWVAYSGGMLLLHLILLCVPIFSIPVAWTITHQIHCAVHLYFLHSLKGAPWISADQGACQKETHWEQIDNGMQYTTTRKFLVAVPVIIFLLTCFYTQNDSKHFWLNLFSLLTVIVPKLPQFHGVRLFGINKY
ncbi:ORM1-like protein [Chrysoperla carnea]|uniref:ORM1-like protein n=1 Tax=Chrysoperla carnea TaxID=189513 RepID=UPI001D09187C|nr:ORM1-like protein [Chrysoperla carnea]